MAEDEDKKRESEDAPEAATDADAHEASEDAESPTDDVQSAAAASSGTTADDDGPVAEDDDDAADDDAADDDAAASEHAADGESTAAKERRKKKTGRKKKAARVTAGERLAAAKAAKAARKAAERGRQAEIVEDKAAETAEAATEALEKHRNLIYGGLVSVVLLAVAFFGWQAYERSLGGDATALLRAAQDTAGAPIVAEPEEGEEAGDDDDDEPESYATLEARAEAALPKFREVLSQFPETRAAHFARLGEAQALLDTESWSEARAAYQRAVQEAGDDPQIAARAYEGIAFSHEGEESWDEALAAYEQLADLGDAEQALADYHKARLHLIREEETEAKETLQGLLDGLREDEDAPELPYVRDQAELRLMAIDSSLVQRSTPTFPGGGIPGLGGPGGGANPLEGLGGDQGIPPEVLRQLQQQLGMQGMPQMPPGAAPNIPSPGAPTP